MDISTTARIRLTTTELLERQVSFDTTGRNSNLPRIGFLREYLDGLGVTHRISTDAAWKKANPLHAVIGPRQARGLAPSGHLATLPVDGWAWTSDRFALLRADDKLFGRGSCDVKGFIAACLAAVQDLLALPLGRPLHRFISDDEEVGWLTQAIAVSGWRPDICAVDEPSGMKPILSHKGKLNLNVTVRGLAGHSSEPSKRDNAVQAAGEAVAWVACEARRLAAEGPFDEGFDPPHSAVPVGTVHGGTVLNTIPEHAAFTVEWRFMPGDRPHRRAAHMQTWIAETIEPATQEMHPDCGFDDEIALEIPGMALPADHAPTAMVQQIAGTASAGNVSYGTERGGSETAGIQTIVCRPGIWGPGIWGPGIWGPGDSVQAHKPDQWIAEPQLAACERFIRRPVSRLLV